ncbi:MAG TPA: CHASE3 domain-containing protein [Candidatus Angelobacter sp.]|jgi:CHASE3 domain sensor protein
MAASNDGKNVLSSALDARKVLPFTLLPLALLFALAISSISRNNDLLRSQALVERTHRVLHEIEGAEDSLQEAREAHLHYILTPEEVDLINFQDAVMKTWVRVERISDMTRDDEGYPERIEQLRDLIKREFQQSLNDMRTTHTLLIFHSPAADANRDRVRAAMQKLKNDEEEILRAGNDAAHARARGVELSVVLLIGGFSVLVAGLLLLVVLGSRKLRSAEQSASFKNSQPEGPVQQRQAESMAATAAGDGKNKSDSTIG